MGVVTQTEKPVASPRVERVLDGVDVGFPLLWLLLYLLLPVSGWSDVMFDSWFDQARDLEALTSVLADGRADAIADSVIGPAYIAAAATLHWVLGLEARDALVALNRASYALSIASALVLVRILVRRFGAAPPLASVAAQLVLVGLVFAAGTTALVGRPVEPLLRGLPRGDPVRRAVRARSPERGDRRPSPASCWRSSP
jgi:hypothetical protein